MINFNSIRVFVLAAMFAFISSCAQTHYNPITPVLEQENLEAVMNSVVILQTESDGLCTGVFVAPQRILTAAHCVARYETVIFMGFVLEVPSDEDPTGSEVNVITRDWYLEDPTLEEVVPTPYRVSRYSADADLALLECDTHECLMSENVVSMLHPANRVGEVAVAIGHPAGLYYTVTTGIFSRDIETEAGVNYIYASSNIWFGNSGGPLLDRQGRLVGIASSMASTGGIPAGHLGRFVYITTIREFLNGRTDFSDDSSEE